MPSASSKTTKSASVSTALSYADLMARVPLFASLSPEDLSALAQGVVKRRFKRGEYLLRQGDTSGALYIVMTGVVSVVATSALSSAKGKEVILATLSRGDYFGEMSLMDGQPRSADVMADALTDVLVLGQTQLMACLQAHPSVAISLMKGLVARLRAADEKIETLALVDVYGRVARALLEIASPQPDGSGLITQKISKQTMAKTIGASREMVTKVFKQFELQGWLTHLDSGALRVTMPE
jgi:CRP-like cAMP-binding protein